MNAAPVLPSVLARIRRWCALATLAVATVVHAADDFSQALIAPSAAERMVSAVRAADDERVAATKAGDRARLAAIYSDELHYGHSNGKVDTKAMFVDALVNRTAAYEKFDYQQREFRPVAPGMVLMTGRALVGVRNAGGRQDLDLSFLAVWRLENGVWRFLAWQSCRNPAPAAAK